MYNSISVNHLRSGHIERMIDQLRHAFDESHCVRQGGVNLERFLVRPVGVDVEQLRIAIERKAWMLRQPASLREGARTSFNACITASSFPAMA
jgi:hypothetical protein